MYLFSGQIDQKRRQHGKFIMTCLLDFLILMLLLEDKEVFKGNGVDTAQFTIVKKSTFKVKPQKSKEDLGAKSCLVVFSD